MMCCWIAGDWLAALVSCKTAGPEMLGEPKKKEVQTFCFFGATQKLLHCVRFPLSFLLKRNP